MDMELEGELEQIAERYSVRIHYFNELFSTNTVASEKRYSHGDLIITPLQSAGRGQRGNSWHSEKGKNLTFSLVLEPRFLTVERQFLLSMAVSSAIAATLVAFGIEARIKWPNDIYVGDGKIAGILIENDVMGNTITRSVVGIGINVNQAAFPESLPNPLSMSAASGREHNIAGVLDKLIGNIVLYYNKLSKNDNSIHSLYHSLLYRREGLHSYIDTASGEGFSASVERVADTGELLLKEPEGNLRRYMFKEVEFVI